MECKGCGLPMAPEEMGVNFKGEKQEYHGFQAKCVELLRAELAKKDLQNGEWEKLVRGMADRLYAIGKGEADDFGRELMVIATELHRRCQVIKGEDPLPHAGERLTEKRNDVCPLCYHSTAGGPHPVCEANWAKADPDKRAEEGQKCEGCQQVKPDVLPYCNDCYMTT